MNANEIIAILKMFGDDENEEVQEINMLVDLASEITSKYSGKLLAILGSLIKPIMESSNDFLIEQRIKNIEKIKKALGCSLEQAIFITSDLEFKKAAFVEKFEKNAPKK